MGFRRWPSSINVYLREYVDEDYLKELEMAFKSVGQKYGFVSAGDVFRQKLAAAEREVVEARQKVAEARAEAHQDGRNDERVAVALDMLSDNEPIEKIVKYSHLPKEKVVELRDSQMKSAEK